jgi:hypothetical protein
MGTKEISVNLRDLNQRDLREIFFNHGVHGPDSYRDHG